jgi:hypothetical protein
MLRMHLTMVPDGSPSRSRQPKCQQHIPLQPDEAAVHAAIQHRAGNGGGGPPG